MSFSNLRLRKRNLELETAAGKVAQAASDVKIGVPGADERYARCLAEFERLNREASPLQDTTN